MTQDPTKSPAVSEREGGGQASIQADRELASYLHGCIFGSEDDDAADGHRRLLNGERDGEFMIKAISQFRQEMLPHGAEEIIRLREALQSVKADITHKRNAQSIVCTVWHDDAETTVDFIDATLADAILARLAPAPEKGVTQDQREQALAAGRAIVHGQGDGTYDEATNAIHLLLAALGGSQPASEKVVRELPAGMKPWTGGDRAPDDWDGGPILYRCGEMGDAEEDSWHVGTAIRGFRPNEYDAIAYTPRAALAQPEAARVGEGVPAGMKLWAGGEEAPSDWDETKPAIQRNGTELTYGPGGWDWRHFGPATADGDSDIIAYTPKTPAPRNANETGQDEAINAALTKIPVGWSWSIGQMMGLPENMRYRCFLSDHNTPDGKASRHVCEDRATPVAAIEAAICAALATQPAAGSEG